MFMLFVDYSISIFPNITLLPDTSLSDKSTTGGDSSTTSSSPSSTSSGIAVSGFFSNGVDSSGIVAALSC